MLHEPARLVVVILPPVDVSLDRYQLQQYLTAQRHLIVLSKGLSSGSNWSFMKTSAVYAAGWYHLHRQHLFSVSYPTSSSCSTLIQHSLLFLCVDNSFNAQPMISTSSHTSLCLFSSKSLLFVLHCHCFAIVFMAFYPVPLMDPHQQGFLKSLDRASFPRCWRLGWNTCLLINTNLRHCQRPSNNISITR